MVAALSQVATACIAIRMALREGPRRVRLALLVLALAVVGICATPAGRLSFTIEGPRLLASDFLSRGSDEQQVVRDGRPLLVAGVIRYRSDDSSEATAEYCFYAMNPDVLVECSATGNPRSTAPRT